MNDYREKALSLIALELAHNETGIYCQSVSGPNGYEKRTERMEGHNECAMSLSKRWGKYSNWLRELPEYCKTDVQNLILDGVITLSEDEEENVTMWVDSSDLFGWGYSNADEIMFSDIPDLMKALEESPDHGGILWVCRKFKDKPQKPYYKYFNDKEKVLFDACKPPQAQEE